MGIAIDAMPIEIDNGDLQTRYLEMGDMAIFIEVAPVEHMRAFNEHVRALFA